MYKRIVKDGSAIDEASPPEMLHTLRIDCKKLRYLLEFFAAFYPSHQVKPLIKNLKNLQDLLGEHQDMHVQSEAIEAFAQSMDDEGAPTETLLAMGALVAILLEKMQAARSHFTERFEAFADPKTKEAFESMLKGER